MVISIEYVNWGIVNFNIFIYVLVPHELLALSWRCLLRLWCCLRSWLLKTLGIIKELVVEDISEELGAEVFSELIALSTAPWAAITVIAAVCRIRTVVAAKSADVLLPWVS